MKKNRGIKRWIQPVHFVVDGQPFATISGVVTEARRRGYEGSFSTIAARLRKGMSTWDKVAANKHKKSGR